MQTTQNKILNIASPDVPFPGELVGQRVIVQGASGSGKSYAIRRILEETYGRFQHIVLDPEDEFFTLRERFDYVLIGGANADAAIETETAAQMAHLILELGVSVIIQLDAFGLKGQRAVIGEFVAGLMTAARMQHPVLVTLDEAHRYAPQAGIVASSEAIVNLATAGRKRRIGAIFATQRLSLLSKDVLGQCQNRVMGRVDQDLDCQAAAKLLGFKPSSAEAQSLLGLHREFWVVGPAFAQRPTRHRFSPALTTHLQLDGAEVPIPPASATMRAARDRLIALKAPKGSIVNEPASAPQLADAKAAEQRGYDRGREEWRVRALKAEGELATAKASLDRLVTAIQRSIKDSCYASDKPNVPAAKIAPPVAKTAPLKPKTSEKAVRGHDAGDHPAGALQLLRTAVTHAPVRFSWAQLATLNGRKARGGYFNKSKRHLLDAGLVEERDDKVLVTGAGFETLGAQAKVLPYKPMELLEVWLDALPSPSKEMLDAIAKGPIGLGDLADRLDLTPRGGYWNKGLSILRSNGLISEGERGWMLGPALIGSGGQE